MENEDEVLLLIFSQVNMWEKDIKTLKIQSRNNVDSIQSHIFIWKFIKLL